MHIINWILEMVQMYWLDIIIVAIAIFGVYIMIKRGNKAKLVELAKFAVKQAEEIYQSESGQLKKNEAIAYLQEKSIIAKLFLNSKQIDDLVENACDWLNNELTEIEQKKLLE